MDKRLNIDNEDLPLMKWKVAAASALRVVALRQREFTSDDIWKALQKIDPQPVGDARMMGHMLTRGRRDGMIRPTDRYVPSESSVNHHRPIRVWESLIFHKNNSQAVTVKS